MPKHEYEQLIVQLVNALPLEERLRIESLAFEVRCARGEISRATDPQGWGRRFLPHR